MNCIIQAGSTVFGVDQLTALNEIEDYQGTDETIVSINSQYYSTQFRNRNGHDQGLEKDTRHCL